MPTTHISKAPKEASSPEEMTHNSNTHDILIFLYPILTLNTVQINSDSTVSVDAGIEPR
jgi:hypothetical protein